jgi:hypothetical protein
VDSDPNEFGRTNRDNTITEKTERTETTNEEEKELLEDDTYPSQQDFAS